VFGDLVGLDPAQTAFVDNPLIAAGLRTRCCTALEVLGRQLVQCAWPANLSVDWSYAAIAPRDEFRSGHAWLGAAALLAGLLALAIAWRRGSSGTAFGLLLALSAWFLVSNLARPVGTVMGERLFTLPVIGLVVAAATAVARVTPPARAALLFLAVPAALAFGWRTERRAEDWRDGLALYEAAERVAPDSARVQATLAHLRFVRGQHELAVRHARRAIFLLPDYGKPHATLANCLAAQRNYGASLVHLWLAAEAPGRDSGLKAQLEAARSTVLREDRARLEFLRCGREEVAAHPDSSLHRALAEELSRVERGGR
jgi:tetratricopeptide (TPR) repeat protein